MLIVTNCCVRLSLLALLVRFLMIEPTHPSANLRFGMGVLYPHRQQEALVDGDFLNLRISHSSFLRVLIEVGCMCMCL
jgi:hypothetical protein